MEEWRSIKGYPDYQVSNLGRVRSLKFDKIKILKEQRTGKDYKYRAITLHKDGTAIRLYVHRVVLESFIGPPPSIGMECNHKDGCKNNNLIDNLEWTTSTENKIHGVINGLYPSGEECPWAKLTKNDVLAIKEMGKLDITQQCIANKFNVDRRQIGRILNGTRWKNYGT